MNVLWLHDRASLQGGAERYVVATAQALRQYGVRSTLLYDAHHPCDPAALAAFDSAFPLVNLEEQALAVGADVIYAHAVRRQLAEQSLAQTRIPVVRFFHDHELFCLRGHKITVLRRATCNRTTSFRCYPCLGFLRKTDSWPHIRIATLLQLETRRALTMGFRAWVVGSQYMAEHVAAHGFDRDRIRILPLYVERPPREPNPPREGDLLLVVGALTSGKGLDVLFHALASLRPPWRLAVAGVGPQDLALRRLAARLGISERVAFLGHVRREDLLLLYRSCACVVMPSRSPETFGLVGIEAMSNATPVVASAIGGILEWLEPGANGLGVPPNDAQALAAAIDSILTDPALGARLGTAGRQTHTLRFLPEHHLTRLHALLQDARHAVR